MPLTRESAPRNLRRVSAKIIGNQADGFSLRWQYEDGSEFDGYHVFYSKEDAQIFIDIILRRDYERYVSL